MNIHSARVPVALGGFRIIMVCAGLAVGTVTWSRAGMPHPPEGDTRLQRLVLSSTLGYQIRVVPDASPPRLTFFALPLVQEDVALATREVGFVYGIGGDPRALPIRWTFSETTVFLSHHLNMPTLHPVDLSRESLPELLCHLRSGDYVQACIQLKPGESYKSYKYCDITPAREALTGLMSLTEEGYERTEPPEPHVVQYDIRAINDTVIELFMTVDQRLTKWVYDGQKWQHVRNYPITIESEFLVCQDGQSLITAREGSWCLVDIEAKAPAFKSIIERAADQPLTVVEDIVKKQTYFEHQGNVFDKGGVKLWSARPGLDKNARAQALVDFVRARRAE